MIVTVENRTKKRRNNMKKANVNVPKETTRVMDLPECWISDDGRYMHFKNSKWMKKLPVVDQNYAQILKDMNVSFRERQCPNGRKVLEYWDKNAYSEYEVTLPLYEKRDNNFIHTGDHKDRVQSEKMLNATIKLRELVETRIKEVAEAQLAQKQAVLKEKYEEVRARLQANKKLAGVGFVSNVIPDFSGFDSTMKVFNLRNVVGNKNYPSFYYVAFDTERIKGKSVINVEVPEGKEMRYRGKQQSNVKYWAGELGVKFVHVVETTK